MILQLIQLDTETQHDDIPSDKTQLIPSTSRKVPTQQVARSDLSISTPFVCHVITEKQKLAFITDAITFTENHIEYSTNFFTTWIILWSISFNLSE